MHWQHNTHPHNSNNTLQPCQHLVPPLNITIKTNQLSSQNHRNGPGEENSLACAMLNTSRKKQIYEASNEGSGRAGVWGEADTSAGPGPLTLTCKLHPHHSPAHDALSSIRGKSSRERGSQLHRQHQSGLEYRSKMPIISKLNLLLWIIPSGEIIILNWSEEYTVAMDEKCTVLGSIRTSGDKRLNYSPGPRVKSSMVAI